MSFDLNAISSETRLRAPRIILLGVEKIGKTTWASKWPNPVLLPIKGEEGADDPMIQGACKVLPVCNTMEDVFSWLASLRSQEHDHGTVIIDSASTLEALVFEACCQKLGLDKDGSGTTNNILKAGGGYGAGYTESLVFWRYLTNWLDTLRTERSMASILIGHVIVGKFDDPTTDTYDRYEFDVNRKAAALLYRWADLILFANTKVVVKNKDVGFGKTQGQGVEVNAGARYLYTQKRPSHPGGGRGIFGRLPYEMPLDYNCFEAAVAEAVQAC